MGEFFKGWKKKVGVLSLMIAVVFMVGWVRSFVSIDQLIFRFGTEQCGAASLDQTFVAAWNQNPTVQWEFPVLTSQKFDSFAVKTQAIDWYWNLLSIRLGAPKTEEKAPNWFPTHFAIPYSYIVIPLTLVSAFLIFTKPRNSAPKKLIEPISENGRLNHGRVLQS